MPRPTVSLGEILIAAIRRSRWLTRLVVAEIVLCLVLVAVMGGFERPPRLLRSPARAAQIARAVHP